MNERIKELALRAGYTPLPGFDFANDLQEVFLKKFAELIIGECIKCCIVAEVNYAINGEIEEADGAIGAKELIVGYFGVE